MALHWEVKGFLDCEVLEVLGVSADLPALADSQSLLKLSGAFLLNNRFIYIRIAYMNLIVSTCYTVPTTTATGKIIASKNSGNSKLILLH